MHEIKLPQLGQSVEEASIVQWLKKEGDTVAKGEPLFCVQTDKAEIECESTASGVLRKIVVPTDEIVPVMTVVALVGEPGEELPAAIASAPVPATPKASENTAPGPATPTPQAAATEPVQTISGPVKASPRAKAAASAHHVSLSAIQGTGVGGRIMEADVAAYAESLSDLHISPTAKRLAEIEGVDLRGVTGTGPGNKIVKEDVEAAMAKRGSAAPVAMPGSRVVPLTPMRRIVAKRMTESKFSAPHYYVTVEVDMTAAKEIRASAQGFKPSYNDLVMMATVAAIKKFPAVNSRWLGDAIASLGEINLGFAVALPTGLIVPVVQGAHDMGLRQLHEACAALVEKARKNRLLPDDYAGSTFTISNLGAFGVDHFTAIINQPDSAILAVGQMKDRPVVIDGGIHIRPIMKLTLSSDHRVIDGAVAAEFMGGLKSAMETGEFNR